MKKSNPIDAAFKNKAKFDTQNPIIGTLLTQIQSGKTKNEKVIEKQLKDAPSIKDLQIAERLRGLQKSNRKNNNDDDDNDNNDPPPTSPLLPPPYFPPSPSTDQDNDSNIKNDLNPTQKFLLGDTPQQEKIAVAVGEKTTAAVKKVRFSENLNKLFPKADDIFNVKKLILTMIIYQNKK